MKKNKMKRFVIIQIVIVIIAFVLFASGFVLLAIENEVTHSIGNVLIRLSVIHLLILVAYTFGGWTMQDYYKEHLSSIEEGHIVLHKHYESKIVKQNEEIKKLKAQIKKMRTVRKL